MKQEPNRTNNTSRTVLVAPSSLIERKARVGYTTARAIWRGGHQPETLQNVTRILFNSQSWGKKWERIHAELLLSNTSEVYSFETVQGLGIREQPCTCPPGKGHNAEDNSC